MSTFVEIAGYDYVQTVLSSNVVSFYLSFKICLNSRILVSPDVSLTLYLAIWMGAGVLSLQFFVYFSMEVFFFFYR